MREGMIDEGEVEQVFAECVLEIGGLDDFRVATKIIDRYRTAEIVGEGGDDATLHFFHVFFRVGIVGDVDEIIHAGNGHFFVFTCDQQR